MINVERCLVLCLMLLCSITTLTALIPTAATKARRLAKAVQ
jgi:hypothetical protein